MKTRDGAASTFRTNREIQIYLEIIKADNSQELAGTGIPETCYFHNHSENFCISKIKKMGEFVKRT